MSEIKIAEERFLSLIKSENHVPLVLSGFIAHLVKEWKKVNDYKTEEQRKFLADYIKNILKENSIDLKVGFNNNYYCNITYMYKFQTYFIGVVDVDPFTGKIKE